MQACNTPQHIDALQHSAHRTLQHTATHGSILQLYNTISYDIHNNIERTHACPMQACLFKIEEDPDRSKVMIQIL